MKKLKSTWIRHEFAADAAILLMSVLVAASVAIAGAGAFVSFVIGILLMCLGEAVHIRLHLAKMNPEKRAPNRLDSVVETYAGVLQRYGCEHPLLQWIEQPLKVLEERCRDAENGVFHLRNIDSINMARIYDSCFGGSRIEKAVCPPGDASYFRLTSGRDSLRMAYDQVQAGNLTCVVRLFILDDVSHTGEIDDILALHEALGWVTAVIDKASFDNVVRLELNDDYMRFSSSFKLFGSGCLCLADRLVNDRMEVKFVWDRRQIGMYQRIFDQAYSRACRKHEPAKPRRDADFDAVFQGYLDGNLATRDSDNHAG